MHDDGVVLGRAFAALAAGDEAMAVGRIRLDGRAQHDDVARGQKVFGNAACHVPSHRAGMEGDLVAHGRAAVRMAACHASLDGAAPEEDGVAHGAARALAARGLEDDGLAAYAHAVLEGHAGPGDATAGVGFDRAGVDGHHVAGDRSVGQPARQQARQGAAGDDDAVALGKAVGPAAHGPGNGA